MRSSLKGIAENILFALNIFIIFLLIVENQLVVPQWLQPVGRMHPMLLHFPIAILMLALILEFFRFKTEYISEKFFQSFASSLLLMGALFSAITVIMGLFLSKEEGYAGSVLQWHKWTGVSIVLLASAIHWLRKYSWYNSRIAKVGAAITIICLLGAGHYGATLTHGENFVLGPVLPKPAAVTIDEAVVFAHLVQPVFEKKCVSCHNPEKIKGKLILTDADNVRKGGKSGKLIVAGKPQLSLLLQRIHLPLDEKKHMPPSGKVQLTDEEIALLTLWVKNGADFEQKVTDLPASDSLRMLASTILKPAEDEAEQFDFAEADEKTLKKLNTSYRVVYPLAKESPALAINLYNKSVYSPKSVEELSEIKKQVVSLNLNKMPVKDAELKTIGQFENLQHLNLNFTDITGTGLKDLVKLTQLKSLSLSGTKLKPGSVRQVSALKSLTQLALWNTGIKEAELQQLKKANPGISIITGFTDDGSNVIKLSPPELKNNTAFFKKTVPLHLSHPINGVEIRYTTNGSEPDSLKSLLYANKTTLTDNTTVKAKAFKKGWFGSDAVSFNFYKNTYKPDSIRLLTPPNERYYAQREETLTDERLGSFDTNGGQWLGYRENDMVVFVQFDKPVSMQSVALNVMQNTGAQIFPPEAIQIWGGKDSKSMRLLTTMKPDVPQKDDPGLLSKVECRFKSQTIACLRIVVKPLKKLPSWHQEKGKPAWVFVDELMLN